MSGSRKLRSNPTTTSFETEPQFSPNSTKTKEPEQSDGSMEKRPSNSSRLLAEILEVMKTQNEIIAKLQTDVKVKTQ